MNDIFGHPLPTHDLDGSIRARLLYAVGDACPARSEARAEYYRAAGRAQRQWDERRAARDAGRAKLDHASFKPPAPIRDSPGDGILAD